MKARWAQTWQRFLVLAHYVSLVLVLFFISLGGMLGWNIPIAVIVALLAVVFLSTFYRIHLRTGFWKLVHTPSNRLNEQSLRLTHSALSLGLIWLVAACSLTVYFKVYMTFNRLTVLDFLAFIYLADTLPSALLAWRGEHPLSSRDALLALGRRFLITVAIIVLLFAVNMLLIRPWQHNWGATAEEINRAMPGDELVASPDMNATRVVTVKATPEAIWPWLLQIGYKRGGFYSYDFLDNGCIPSARTILPEFQQLAVGDQVAVGEGAYMHVVAIEPEQSLVMQFGEGPWAGNTWTFGLYPAGPGETRLVSRLRARYHWEFPHIVPWLFIDTFEIIMMRRCLLGIKERAEGMAGIAAAGASQ